VSRDPSKYYFARLRPDKERRLFAGTQLLHEWLLKQLELGLYRNQDLALTAAEIARYLVDHGLPSIARKLRLLAEAAETGGDGRLTAFMLFSELLLFCRRMQTVSGLNGMEREDLLSFCGVPFYKRDLPANRVLRDRWLYMGKVVEQEEQLNISRHWFYGLQSQRKALVINFQAGKQQEALTYKRGFCYESPATFYPSNTPFRVAGIDASSASQQWNMPPVALSVADALDDFAKMLVLNPFLRSTFYLLESPQLVRLRDVCYLRSGNRGLIPISNDARQLPAIYGLGGLPNVCFAAEYCDRQYHVIAIIAGERFIPIGRMA